MSTIIHNAKTDRQFKAKSKNITIRNSSKHIWIMLEWCAYQNCIRIIIPKNLRSITRSRKGTTSSLVPIKKTPTPMMAMSPTACYLITQRIPCFPRDFGSVSSSLMTQPTYISNLTIFPFVHADLAGGFVL